jgi:hypothetical protein
MSESKHLAETLKRLYFGRSVGIFAPFEAATEGLTARQASAVPIPRFNSVAGIVNHVWFWQEALRLLLTGQPYSHTALGAPDESGWPPACDPDDDEGWIASRQRALDVNTALADLAAGLSNEELESTLEVWGAPKHRAVQGIIAHNSYHTAEIICVRHMQGLWLEST